MQVFMNENMFMSTCKVKARNVGIYTWPIRDNFEAFGD